MTAADLDLARGAIRAVRESATGRGILGPAALNLADAVEVLAVDHERVVALLVGARAVIRDTEAASSPSVAALLRRINEHLEKQT